MSKKNINNLLNFLDEIDSKLFKDVIKKVNQWGKWINILCR